MKYLLLLLIFSSFFIYGKEKKINTNIEKEIQETLKESLERGCSINYDKKYTFDTGLIVGTPNGLDFRFYLPYKMNLEAILGVDFFKNFLGSLGLNYQYTVYQNKVIKLNLDGGFKTVLGTKIDEEERKFKLTLGIPLGITIPIKNSAISFSTYFAPGMSVKPNTEWDYSWGVAFNYNFEIARRERKSRKCLAGKLDKLGGEFGKLGGAFNKLGGAFDKLGGEYDKLGQKNQELGQKNSELDQKNNELDQMNNALNEKNKQLETEKIALNTEKENLESEKKNLESKKIELENELEEKLKNPASSEEAKKLKKQLEDLKKEKEESDKKIAKNDKKSCELSDGIFTNGKCICPAGKVSRSNMCVCPSSNQAWSTSSKKCVCKRGFSLKNGTCKACSLRNYWGTCVNSCPKPQVKWNGRCICSSSRGYKRASNGSCVCKAGYKDYGDGVCIQAGN